MALSKAAWWGIGIGAFAVLVLLGIFGWGFAQGFRRGYHEAACRDRRDVRSCSIACEAGKSALCVVLGDAHARAGHRRAAQQAYDEACREGVAEGCQRSQALH